MSDAIYLDNHSATKPCQSALERMKLYLEDASFLPHRMGPDQIAAIDGRIQMLYDLVGAKPNDRFVFTASGAEAIYQVYWSIYFEVARKEGKCHFVTSELEDTAQIQGLKRCEDLGCIVKTVPCDKSGRIDIQKLSESINPRTALVSVCLAQGITGIVQPIQEIAKICQEKNVYLHVDATYGIGKISLEFISDYLTFSGDRMHALKSSGALFAKARCPLSPLMSGASGMDIPSLASLTAAAQQSILTLDVMGLEVARLREKLEKQILERIPGTQVLLGDSLRLPNVSVIAFPRVHQEALLYALNHRKVFASMGGGCHQELSRLLISSGYDERIAVSALSFSLSRMTTEMEINEALMRIVDAHTSIAGDFEP